MRRVVTAVRRLASPAGLILAGLCLLLPFVSASCTRADQSVHWRVTYTGADILTGGRPDLDYTDDASREPMRRLDDAGERQVLGAPPASLPAQPVAWLAAVLLAAALAATVLRSRMWRAAVTAGLALAAATVLAGATVLARRDATDAVAAVVSGVAAGSPAADPREWEYYGQVRDLFRFEYGFWIAIGLLGAVGVLNTVRVVRDKLPVGE